MEPTPHQISNPLQAASEVFYKPKAVFTALSQVNNWSWIPFILVSIMLVIPSYLYYQIVDLSWLVEQLAIAGNPDGSPAEIENAKAQIPTQALPFTAFFAPIAVIIVNAILAGYYTFVCRNDEKCVQGFTDWYGATWWISMPVLINGFLALLLLAMQDAGTQISTAYIAPTSLAFVLGMDMTDTMYNYFMNIGLTSIWSIILAAYCIKSWTSFSMQKSFILAIIPTAVFLGISILFYL